jgi:hypothetical protein
VQFKSGKSNGKNRRPGALPVFPFPYMTLKQENPVKKIKPEKAKRNSVDKKH